MLKDLIKRGLKDPLKIPRAVHTLCYTQIKGRVPFQTDQVSTGFNPSDAELPQFSSRIYIEAKLLDEAVGDYKAKRSLEIGCGYGRMTPWIAEHSEHHYAIDPEKSLLAQAEKLNPGVTFNQSTAQKLPFPDNYFDLCVSWTVLQHIPPGSEFQKSVSELKRVCSPQGRIILTEGVGEKRDIGYWEHTIEGWTNALKPWTLIWQKQRILENTFIGDAGAVMRFTKPPSDR